jgi:uncharacterized protein (TIGR04255 family)
VSRPLDLPDFKDPPLNEVALGIQFAQPKGYTQIQAGEVWGLYRKGFPHVQEQPPLAPTFETFGLPQGAQMNFGIVTGASHDRFWFISEKKDELLQFQNDRFLHNWRKVGDNTDTYPRFEGIVEKFERELLELQEYFAGLTPQSLIVNQCEISYINHIPFELKDGICPVEDWLSILHFGGLPIEDFNCTFRRPIQDDKGITYARLISEAAVGIDRTGRRVIILTLTVRGAPRETTVKSALELLGRGHEMIVKVFAEITTSSAHKIWGRIQ